MTDLLEPSVPVDAPVDAPFVRPRRRLRWVLTLLLVVLGTAVVVVLFTPLVAVRTVDVVGEVEVPREQLLAAAGVRVGDPLARVDLRAARSGLRSLPQVASARAERSWDGTVRLTVTPERPLVGVVGPESAALVSANGRVVRVVKDAAALPPILPRVAVERLPRLRAGETLGPPVDDVLEVYAEATGALLVELFDGVLDASGALTFTSPRGGKILFGPVESVPSKLLAVETVLGGRVVRTCLAVLDVRDPDRPTVSRQAGCAVTAPTVAGNQGGAGGGRTTTGTTPPQSGTLVCTRVGCKVVAADGSVVAGNPAVGEPGPPTGPGGSPGGTGGSTTSVPATTVPPAGGKLVCDKFGCKVVPA
ncbi:MAG: cell division protein FtsQ/DivIB [Actinomycetes bacterium]